MKSGVGAICRSDVFLLGLDDETIRCDLPACNFPLIELVNLIFYLNGSNFEVEELKSVCGSHHQAPSETRHIAPVYPKPGIPIYRTNGLNRLSSLISPDLLQSNIAVLSLVRPTSSPHSRPLTSSPRCSLPEPTPPVRPPETILACNPLIIPKTVLGGYMPAAIGAGPRDEAKAVEADLPWPPELSAPLWPPKLSDPPWPPELPVLPWPPELPDPPLRSSLYPACQPPGHKTHLFGGGGV